MAQDSDGSKISLWEDTGPLSEPALAQIREMFRAWEYDHANADHHLVGRLIDRLLLTIEQRSTQLADCEARDNQTALPPTEAEIQALEAQYRTLFQAIRDLCLSAHLRKTDSIGEVISPLMALTGAHDAVVKHWEAPFREIARLQTQTTECEAHNRDLRQDVASLRAALEAAVRQLEQVQFAERQQQREPPFVATPVDNAVYMGQRALRRGQPL